MDEIWKQGLCVFWCHCVCVCICICVTGEGYGEEHRKDKESLAKDFLQGRRKTVSDAGFYTFT